MNKQNINTAEDTARGTNSKKIALLVTAISSFLTPFMGSSINIGLPAIGNKFSMDAVTLSWVATSYLLSAAVFLVPIGRIADIYGRKKVFLIGILVYTISSLLCGAAFSASFLIFSRMLQGIGSAMIFGTGIAILTSVYPVGERGKALGINVATTYLGLSMGPFLGGFLTQQLGWRSLFYANVPVGILVLLLVTWKLKGEWAEARGEKFDILGSAVFSLTLISLMYGFTLLPSYNGTALILAGIMGFISFVKWENRIRNPILNMALFRHNTVFAFSNLAALINYSATFAITFLLSLYLQYVKSLSPQNTGLILVVQPAIMALVSPFAGRLSDRIEPRILASAGMALLVVGLLVLLFIGHNTSLLYITGALVLLGLGFGLFSSPNTNAVMSSVEKKLYGIASATLATMRLTGQMLSMAISIMVFSVYIGKVRITPEYYGLFLSSMHVLFIIFIILCLGGIFASLARGKVR
ncbi:MAG: MFS transporter [Ignavibacteriales bacterium]